MEFLEFDQNQLINMLKEERKLFKRLQKADKTVDMTRGRPESSQLDISMPMLSNAGEYNYCIDGMDLRNYGGLQGIKPARQLFADLLEVDTKNIIIGGSSSLNLMYDYLNQCMYIGVAG